MGRPRTRTAVLDEGEKQAFDGAFASCTFAYSQLGIASQVTYPSFQRVWRGEPVTPRELRAVREAWTEWSLRMIQVLREGQKLPVGEMFTPEGSPAVPFDVPAPGRESEVVAA